ncbi:MAG: AMP-binding protein [Spirochaetota bacterium]|nr:AMP-binding protein [Spirochaetota bacterium]
MADDKRNMLKMLLNRRIIGLLMRSRTRKLMTKMRSGNIFLSALDDNPEKEAIIYGDKKFTYREFRERMNRLNNGLLSLGIKEGDHIAAFLGNSNSFLEVVYGPSLAGIISTPINWHLKGEEIEYIVNNSDAKAFFIEEQFIDKLKPIKSKLKGVKHFIMVGENIPDDMIDYEKFLSESSSADLESTVTGGGFMLYTSGTTGRPKGTHSRALKDPSILEPDDIASFVVMLDNMLNGFDYHKTTNRHLVVGPLYHAAPLGFAGMTFAHGGTVAIMRKFDAEEALKFIEKEKLSTTFIVPILLKRLLSISNKDKYDVNSMKSIVCAAAPCPAELKKEVVDFFGPVFYEFYGSTDAGINTILKPKHYLKNPEKYASVGIVAGGNKLKIVDENGNVAPTRATGDLYVSNPMVKYLEYYKDPDKTKSSFMEIDGEQYFIEGEVAYLDEENFCYIVDRKKDMIISGGVNIYPAEIEEVIHLHPSVMDVAVIGIPDKEWGEAIKAFIVTRKGMNLTEKEIIDYCSEHLAGYKRPKSIEFVDDLPRNPDGKLVKRLLKEKYAATAT